MKGSLFDFIDYKLYLQAHLRALPGGGRGEKSRIAQAIRCHTAYITQVFNGSAHLSLEQATDLCVYLGHSTEEEHFFLLLVQSARAGSAKLRVYLEREMKKVLEARLILKNRFKISEKLSESDQSTYYSAWYYSAVYALVSVPALSAPREISATLSLPFEKVTEVLRFLVSTGLVTEDSGQYRIGKTSIHLGSDSALISKHHTNWRMQAIQSLDLPAPMDLHYSSVVSLSESDLPKVRAVLVKAIEEVRAVVRTSPEEAVCAYTLDLFQYRKNRAF